MGFGFSVRRLVTEILEFQKKKLVENRKITYFLQATLKLNSENFYCHRASSFDVSHRFIGEEDQTKMFYKFFARPTAQSLSVRLSLILRRFVIIAQQITS